MSSMFPMIAIMTRNKFLGWTAVIFAVQSWLAETPAQRAKSATPGYFSVLMAIMSLAVVSSGSETTDQPARLTLYQSVIYATVPAAAAESSSQRYSSTTACSAMMEGFIVGIRFSQS